LEEESAFEIQQAANKTIKVNCILEKSQEPVNAVVDSVSSCHFITTTKLVSLSVAQVIKCGFPDCESSGNMLTSILQYIQQHNISIASSSDTGCDTRGPQCGSTLYEYKQVRPSGNETALQVSVYQSPLLAVIDGSLSSLQFYSGGIYYDPSCSATNVNLPVLVVGWGVQGADEFWILKFFWGTGFGESGYLRLAKNKKNACGIATYAFTLSGCEDCS